MDGQQSQAGQTANGAFDTVRVADGLSQHLITTTDAHHGTTLAVCLQDSLSTTIAAQFQQVVERGFRARQDDDVGTLQVGHIVGIEQVDARVALQRVEVGEVRDMAQQHHRHVHLALRPLAPFLLQTDGVFLVDIDVFIIRYHAQHGYATEVFQHAPSLVEEAQVATELIDNNTLDESAVFLALQHDAAIDRGKDAPSVDVAYQDDSSPRMARHRQVDEVGSAQVDFGDAARALHHDGVIPCCQAVEGAAYLLAEVEGGLRGGTLQHTIPAPVVVGIAVADGATVEHHLRGMVGAGLEQQGVHVGMAGDACGLGLYGLGTSYLQSLGGGIGVERHVLCLEGGGMVAILPEDATQGCRQHALAHVAARSCQHDWF